MDGKYNMLLLAQREEGKKKSWTDEGGNLWSPRSVKLPRIGTRYNTCGTSDRRKDLTARERERERSRLERSLSFWYSKKLYKHLYIILYRMFKKNVKYFKGI